MNVLAAVLNAGSFCFLLAGGTVVLYYWSLAIAAVLLPRSRRRANLAPRNSFLILIPAHDEERVLPQALRSCRGLDYPKRLYKVVVIADNCADRTAEIARSWGADCQERSDPGNPGKGCALDFAFAKVGLGGHDAVVVLDADSALDRDALRAFDARLRAGERVLQSAYVASNPDESVISFALAVGNNIENRFFYAPKSRLGAGVFLRGTGMVVQSDVLERCPWQGHSITEDSEYTVALAQAGFRVHFVPETAVRSAFPHDLRQLRVQRTRWSNGNFELGRMRALGLIRNGIRLRRWAWVDLGWTFLAQSRPLAIMALLAAFSMALGSRLLEPGGASLALMAGTAAIAAAFLAYVLLGVIGLGLTRRRTLLLLGTPAVVAKLTWITLSGLLGPKERVWSRTPR